MTAVLAVPPSTNVADDRLYEVVDGERKEKNVRTRQNLIAFRLGRFLVRHDPEEERGHAVIENLFLLDAATDLQRRPDFAFVSRERWSGLPPNSNAWDVVPDWMVEIVSPSNSADEVIDKVDEYFRAGTQLVWVIFPNAQQVYVYTSPTEVTVHKSTDELTAAPVLPSLRFAAHALFEGISVAADRAS
jgi:Uma2 family endonuclease